MLRKCIWVWFLVFTALSVVLMLADEQAKTADDKQPSTAAAQKKPALADAVRVSTDAILHNAAKQEAKKASSEKEGKDPTDNNILEFRPANPDSTSPAKKDVVVTKDSKKSPLKDIHGEVYGTTGRGSAGTRGAGGAVGASSKSGKTSIYVETEGSRTTPPR